MGWLLFYETKGEKTLSITVALAMQRGLGGPPHERLHQDRVEGNWWKVFFFIFLSVLSALGCQFILNSILTNIPVMKNFWGDLISVILPKFIVIGMAIGNILLFLNLDYQKSLES
ncbi:MAG: hypothetical protein F6K50_48370 [Moorea sp. SIO3I7]|nr:hypothetical protein [Moorena sp. SIO3I7]